MLLIDLGKKRLEFNLTVLTMEVGYRQGLDSNK